MTGKIVVGQEVLQQKISISFSNQTVEQALFELGKQLNVSFSYNASKFPIDSVVTQNFKDEFVEEVVQDLLHEKVELSQKGRHVIIRSTGVKKQSKRDLTITGQVTDYTTKIPLENVTVHILESSEISSTNAKGYYTIEVTTRSTFIELVYNTKGYESEVVVIEPSDEILVNVGLKLNSIEKIETKPSQPIVNIAPKPSLEESAIAKILVTDEQRFITEDLLEFLQDRSWQVSVLPMLGTNGSASGIIDNKLSLNIFAGYNHGVDGFELGGFLNLIENDVKGAQIGGFGNVTGNNLEGLQVGGFFNHNFGKVKGLQIGGFSNSVIDSVHGLQIGGFSNIAMNYVYGVQLSGFTNFVRDTIEGVQAAGFLNVTKSIKGIQLAGFVNYSEQNTSGIQGAGFINYAGGVTEGLQVAGFANYSDSILNGSQIAGYGNYAEDKINGFQIAGFGNLSNSTVNGGQISAFINRAKRVNGVQIGIINISDTLKGFPIGLVNIIKSGYVRHEIMSADFMAINYSFKSGIQHFYTIWRGSYSERSNQSILGAGFGFGSSFNILEDKLSTDINVVSSFVYIEPPANNPSFNLHNKFEWNLSYNVFKWLEIFGGASFNYYLTDNLAKTSIQDYVPKTARDVYSNVTADSWIGWQVGLRL